MSRVTHLEQQVQALEAATANAGNEDTPLESAEDSPGDPALNELAARVDELEAIVEELEGGFDDGYDDLGEDDEEDMLKSVEGLSDRLVAVRKNLDGLRDLTDDEKVITKYLSEEALNDFANMTKPQRKRLMEKNMPKDIENTEEAKKAELAKAEEAKKAADAVEAEEAKKAALAKKNDETLTINGREFKKSAVGEEAFAILKAQAEETEVLRTQVTKTTEDLAKERDARRMGELTKRATDELGHLPGTPEEKAGVLKALDEMPEECRTTIEAMFKAGEGAMVHAFNTLGTQQGDVRKAAGDFKKRVAEVKSRDNCTESEAMAKARKEYPEEFKASQGAN